MVAALDQPGKGYTAADAEGGAARSLVQDGDEGEAFSVGAAGDADGEEDLGAKVATMQAEVREGALRAGFGSSIFVVVALVFGVGCDGGVDPVFFLRLWLWVPLLVLVVVLLLLLRGEGSLSHSPQFNSRYCGRWRYFHRGTRHPQARTRCAST